MPKQTKSISLAPHSDQQVTINRVTPKAEDEPKPEPEENLEALKGAIPDILDSLGYQNEPDKKKAKDEPENPPAAEPTPEPKSEPEPKTDEKKDAPAPQPKEEPAAQPAPALDEDALAAKVAAKVADTVKPPAAQQEPPAEPEPIAPAQSIDPDDAHTLEVYRVMAEKHPDKYKGLDAQFQQFIAQEAEYRAAWQRKHPGKAFDPEDATHQKFYDEHEPQLDADDRGFERDFNRAEAAHEARVEAQRERLKLERQLAERDVTTRIPEITRQAQQEMITAIDPQFKDVAGNIPELAKRDRITAHVVQSASTLLDLAVTEVEKIWTPALGYQVNLNNPMHQQIVGLLHAEEQAIAADPKQQSRDGRRFATLDQYHRMPPEQQARVWTVWEDGKAVRGIVTRKIAADAQEKIKELRELVGSPASSSTPDASKVTQREEPAPTPAPAPAKVKPSAPNMAGSDDAIPVGGKGSENSGGLADTILSGLFS